MASIVQVPVITVKEMMEENYLKKVLIMLDKGVEDVEFLYPFYRFQEEGFEVAVVASKARETYIGKHGVPMQSDLSPDDVKVDEYECLIIPGGRAPDYMRTDRQLVNIVKEAYLKGKVVAAICHGPQMLIEADLLRTKKATCWKSVITDLKNAGANFIDEAAVVDGNMVTSRSPADLPDFCRETIKLLTKHSESHSQNMLTRSEL
jgi:protease I